MQNAYNVAQRSDQAGVRRLRRRRGAVRAVLPARLGVRRGQSRARGAGRDAGPPGASGSTPVQVALAWLLALAPNVLLIPGTSSLAHLEENLAADSITLDPDALDELEHVQPAGWSEHAG